MSNHNLLKDEWAKAVAAKDDAIRSARAALTAAERAVLDAAERWYDDPDDVGTLDSVSMAVQARRDARARLAELEAR